MREAGPDHDQRAAGLRQLVASGAERGDVGRAHVLHLVHEQGDAHGEVSRDRGRVGQQLGEVDLEVAGVGAAARRRDVDAQLRRIRPLRRGRVTDGERLEHAEEVIDPVRRPVPGRELADRHVQRRGYGPPDRLVRPRLDLPRAPEPLHRH